jgi:hypothetical protein
MESAMVAVDRDGRLVHWNDTAEQFFETNTGKASTGQWAAANDNLAAAINLPVRNRNGEVLAFPARFNHLFGPHGEPAGAVAIFAARRGSEQPWTPVDP